MNVRIGYMLKVYIKNKLMIDENDIKEVVFGHNGFWITTKNGNKTTVPYKVLK